MYTFVAKMMIVYCVRREYKFRGLLMLGKKMKDEILGLYGQVLAVGRTTGIASLRSQKLPACPAQPMPASSRMDM